MRKFTLIFAICAVLLIAGCSTTNDNDGSNTSTPPTSQTTPDASKEPDSNIMEGTGTINDCEITIKSCEKTIDYKGDPAVLILYDFVNNSDSEQSFLLANKSAVYQNGIECESTVPDLNGDIDNNIQMKDIKPGATLEVPVVYKLNDETTDVVVEITDLFATGSDNPMITKTFALK